MIRKRSQKAAIKQQKRLNISVRKSQIRDRLRASNSSKRTPSAQQNKNYNSFLEEVNLFQGSLSNFKKCKVQITNKEVDEFYRKYTEEFLEKKQLDWKKSQFNQEDFEFILKHKQKLALLYQIFKQKGGFKKVIAELQLSIIKQILNWEDESEERIREMYEKYLYHFERFFSSSNPIKNKKTLQSLNPSLLKEAPTFPVSNKHEVSKELMKKVVSQDIAIIRNFDNAVGFNTQLFCPSTLKNDHYDFMVDVVTQDPEALSFSNLQQQKRPQKLGKFIEYQQEFEYDPAQSTDFCVNIDIGSWDPQMKELQSKIPKEVFCLSEYDVLRHSPIRILGVTDPQMYLKVKGNWTGGHQENLRLRAANINHGPGQSIWYCIENKFVPLFRKKVKKQFKIDIFKSEGQWFADIDWCISNGIEVIVFIQRAGDLVLLGPGTEHWVRSLGKTSQTAWNFATCDSYQFQQINERYLINKQIRFKTIMPVMSLYMQIAQKEMSNLDLDSLQFFQQNLSDMFKKAIQKRSKYQERLNVIAGRALKVGEHNFVKAQPHCPAYLCDLCGNELFSGFIFSCELINRAQWLCGDCALPILKKDKQKIKKCQFLYRYDKKEFDSLLKKLDWRVAQKIQKVQKEQIIENNSKFIEQKLEKRVKKTVNWSKSIQKSQQDPYIDECQKYNILGEDSLTNGEQTPLLLEEESKHAREEISQQYDEGELDDLEFSQKEITPPQNLLDLIPKKKAQESNILERCLPPQDSLKKLVPFSKTSKYEQRIDPSEQLDQLIEDHHIKEAFNLAKRESISKVFNKKNSFVTQTLSGSVGSQSKQIKNRLMKMAPQRQSSMVTNDGSLSQHLSSFLKAPKLSSIQQSAEISDQAHIESLPTGFFSRSKNFEEKEEILWNNSSQVMYQSNSKNLQQNTLFSLKSSSQFENINEEGAQNGVEDQSNSSLGESKRDDYDDRTEDEGFFSQIAAFSSRILSLSGYLIGRPVAALVL